MAAGDLRIPDLVAIINDLRARVTRLEVQVGARTVMFAAQAAVVSGTSFVTVAWTVFPRSGSSLSVDVSVGGALEVQAVVDGVPVGVPVASAGAGTVTVSGFLPSGWVHGARKRVDVQARRTSGSGDVPVTVLGGWHR